MDENKKKDHSLAIGLGLKGAGLGLNTVMAKKALKRMYDSPSEKELKILDKLLKTYKPEKTKFLPDTADAGSVYADELKTLLEESGLNKKLGEANTDSILDAIKGIMHTGPATTPDTIYASKSKIPEIIAHEVGHNRYMNGLDSKAGQIIHKLMGPSRIIGEVAGPVAGIVSGIRKANLEDKGLEESKLNKHAAWAVPTAFQLPILAGEAAASINGIKNLEALGAFANKAEKLAAQKNLATALATYLGAAVVSAGGGMLARGLAYKIRKAKLKKEKEREKKFSDIESLLGNSYINAQVSPYRKRLY